MLVVEVAAFVAVFMVGTAGTAHAVGRIRACAYPCPRCNVGPWEPCVKRRGRKRRAVARPGRPPHRERQRLVRRRFFEMAGWMLIEFGVVGAAVAAAWWIAQ